MRHILVVCLLCVGCGSVMSASDEDADAGADVGSDVPGEVPDAPVDDAPIDEVSTETTDSSSDESADDSDMAVVDFTGPCLVSQDFEGDVPAWWLTASVSLSDEVVHSGAKALKVTPHADGTITGSGIDFNGTGLTPPYVVEGWIYWPGGLTPDEFDTVMMGGGQVVRSGALVLRYLSDHTRTVYWYGHSYDSLGTWEEAQWIKVDTTVQCVGLSWKIGYYLNGIKMLEEVDDHTCGDTDGWGFGAGTLARPLYIDDLCIREWLPVS